VDHHDEAMDWAKNKVFDINPQTGALQILDTKFIDALPSKTSQDIDTLFGTFLDGDLLRTGLPQGLLPAIRALKTTEGLDEIQQYLPAEAYEALFWIANLGYSVEQALNETTHPQKSIDPNDLSQALSHPDSKRRFVSVKNVDELVEILNAPLAKWRIFLHPSQASLVSKDFNGPARVLGGAGTGKTVVAMHRARHLATNVFTKSTDRILVTTYSKTLANNLRSNLQSLCGSEFERIEVIHLHSWAVSFLRSQGVQFNAISDEEINQCWSDAFSAVGIGEWSPEFFKDEWNAVIQGNSISTREEYLNASRIGQRIRLTRPQRDQVWDVFDEYKRNLSAIGKMEWVDMIRQTRLYLQSKNISLPYKAIIIDETQDFHQEDLKLIRQIVPDGANDLFFVGDAHQRIFGKPVTLSRCEINIKGRSSKLKINYRTTEEIRNWSLRVLNSEQMDDLDGGIDTDKDYKSLLHGMKPDVLKFSSLSDEKKYIINHIKSLLEVANTETICLAARTNRQLLDDYIPALISAKLDYVLLGTDTPDNDGAGVRLATMHRIKGLEFHHVLIAGVNAGVVPLEHRNTGDIDASETLIKEKCLFHVSCTRARDTLTITCYGVSSEFLQV
jgi:superfamily I DNA/RNA helicase